VVECLSASMRPEFKPQYGGRVGKKVKESCLETDKKY
jgi:hypothetical protein